MFNILKTNNCLNFIIDLKKDSMNLNKINNNCYNLITEGFNLIKALKKNKI